MDFKYEVSLKSVLEGGLHMDLPIKDDNITMSVKVDKSFLQPKKNIENMGYSILSNFKGDADVRRTADDLKDALSSTGGFVVPGGGTFFYKDPIFSKNRDLLISAEYDG